jgi:glycosyltransferase involved in cell wall biosynthesis
LAPNGRDPDVFHPAEPATGLHATAEDGSSGADDNAGAGSVDAGNASGQDDNPGAGSMPAGPLVLFVGALTGGKRPDRFVEVVARLRTQGTEVRAELIGDGPLRDELVGPARDAGVELRGSRSDIARQMRRADVMIFCSRPAGEGMPGVLIEAGLSGLPVVATSTPGVTSIVNDGETGFVVPVDDLAAMVAATTRLVGDGELRSKMGGSARQWCVDNFSLASVSARWLAHIQPLMDTDRSAGRPA